MADIKSQRVNVDQITAIRKSINNELENNLNDEGRIDVLKLRENSETLAEIFDLLTLSKTGRDDPKKFSKEVARMISARDSSSTLSDALSKLEEKLSIKK